MSRLAREYPEDADYQRELEKFEDHWQGRIDAINQEGEDG